MGTLKYEFCVHDMQRERETEKRSRARPNALTLEVVFYI